MYMYSRCGVLSVGGSCVLRSWAALYEGGGHSGSALASSVEKPEEDRMTYQPSFHRDEVMDSSSVGNWNLVLQGVSQEVSQGVTCHIHQTQITISKRNNNNIRSNQLILKLKCTLYSSCIESRGGGGIQGYDMVCELCCSSALLTCDEH